MKPTRQTKWKEKKYDNLLCVHCNKSLEENNLGRLCFKCKNRHKSLTAYRRWFIKLFN